MSKLLSRKPATASAPAAASKAAPTTGDKRSSMLRRLLPALGFVLGLLVLVVAVYDDGYGALPPSEKRYSVARTAVDSLKGDTRRSVYRDQWLRLAEEFYDIYQSDAQWPNRPAALYRSAEVLEELAARSFAVRDHKAALERYELLAKEHASSRLADDALLRAAIIRARHLDDRGGALRVLQHIRTEYPRGDMAPDAAELEKNLQAAVKLEEQAKAEEKRRVAAHQEEMRRTTQRLDELRREVAKLEGIKKQAPRVEELKREAARLEAFRKESSRQEEARLEAARQEGAKAEAQRQEAVRRESEKQQDLARREAERQEAARLEAARGEAAKQEVLRKEAERQLALRQEEAKRDAARLEEAKRETARLEALAKAAEERARKEADAREAERKAAEAREAQRKVAEAREAERKAADVERRAVAAEKRAVEAERKAAEAARPAPAVVERDARLTQVSWTSIAKDKVQITVELNRHAPWQVRMREGDKSRSPRLVLEMGDTVPVQQVQSGARVKDSLLTRVLVARNKNNSTALSFDFASAERYDTRVEQDPFRIVLTVMAGNAMPSRGVGARVGFSESSLPDPDSARVPERRVTAVRMAVAEAATLDAKENKERQSAATATAPVRRLPPVSKASAANMAEQLGLTVQTVFIDAGHGGKDPGTLHNGVVERELVLDISRRVGRLLTANGLDVVYSRTADHSVPLSERPQRANGAKADLFVSIHVNAHPDASISGFETFYLDLARNAQAARVATLENAASDRKLGDMQSVLADVMLNARTDESSRLAGDIQRVALSRLGRRGFDIKDGGTRAAPFHVLIGAGMPAVLVEVGYCTNTREAKLLGSANYRHALSEGIAEGIMAYKNRLQTRHSAQFTLTSPPRGAI